MHIRQTDNYRNILTSAFLESELYYIIQKNLKMIVRLLIQIILKNIKYRSYNYRDEDWEENQSRIISNQECLIC